MATQANWPKINRRRGKLIKKNIAGKITDAEQGELDALQAYADYHIEQVAPRPPAPFEEPDPLDSALDACDGDIDLIDE